MSVPDGKLRALVLAFAARGIDHNRRADRLRLYSDAVGRHITSGSQLTETEVDQLLARLDRLPPGTDLRHAAARLVQLEEERAAAAAARSRAAAEDPNRVLSPEEVAARLGGVILCGPAGPITDGDAAAVEQFALDLDIRAARP